MNIYWFISYKLNLNYRGPNYENATHKVSPKYLDTYWEIFYNNCLWYFEDIYFAAIKGIILGRVDFTNSTLEVMYNWQSANTDITWANLLIASWIYNSKQVITSSNSFLWLYVLKTKWQNSAKNTKIDKSFFRTHDETHAQQNNLCESVNNW